MLVRIGLPARWGVERIECRFEWRRLLRLPHGRGSERSCSEVCDDYNVGRGFAVRWCSDVILRSALAGRQTNAIR